MIVTCPVLSPLAFAIVASAEHLPLSIEETACDKLTASGLLAFVSLFSLRALSGAVFVCVPNLFCTAEMGFPMWPCKTVATVCCVLISLVLLFFVLCFVSYTAVRVTQRCVRNERCVCVHVACVWTKWGDHAHAFLCLGALCRWLVRSCREILPLTTEQTSPIPDCPQKGV